jgi:hypothetical protein
LEVDLKTGRREEGKKERRERKRLKRGDDIPETPR